ncbi:MAG: NAD(P)H-dependent oxidoreductase [Deltaproteobacteria bacterium]|nr:NAD(P)H-dependent oxidoreductase [Deltaproteobacteria bacterium]
MIAGTAILGSARSDGNTASVLEAVLGDSGFGVIDLSQREIAHYKYRSEAATDDFLAIARRLVESPVIVMATPVYWYAMSGRMKVFFDRLTDLTSRHKEMGRSLAGKTMLLVTSSTEATLPLGFEEPFRASSDYLNMKFGGAFHGWCPNGAPPGPDVLAAAKAFGEGLWRGDLS